MNINTTSVSEKSDKSLSEIEKYNNEKYVDVTYDLKERIIFNMQMSIDSSQVITVLHSQNCVCLQSEIFFFRDKLNGKRFLLKFLIKSGIKQVAEHCESPKTHCNYDNLQIINTNSTYSVKTEFHALLENTVSNRTPSNKRR